MKKPSQLGKRNPTPYAVAFAAAILLTTSATAQVKIPARSASSLEGNNGEAAEQPTAPTATTSSPFSGTSSVSRVSVPTPSTDRGNVTVQSLPVTSVAPDPNVAAVQQVPTPPRDLDPATVKRLADLRRELGISSAALSARLALPADELFRDDAPTTLDELAVPSLKKVIEYIELNDKQNVTVQGFYDQAPGGKELGWARTLALIEWMAANSTIDVENIKAAGPAPVVKATPKPNATEIGDTEFVNRIELMLE